jgi:AcrR family transcriptional regulator
MAAGNTAAAGNIGAEPADGRRKGEILDMASRLFASSGLRTSLQDIADACGIKPGSLYHHFESKEAIVVELVQRYHDELDLIGEVALSRLNGPLPPLEQVTELGTAIAQCAVRHSAAVQFTFYEPPAGASGALVQAASRPPAAVQSAMLAIAKAGQADGSIRAAVDLEMLADRAVQTMLHVALTLFQGYALSRPATVRRVTGLLCGILLHGVAAGAAADEQMDRSGALAAVDQVIRTWDSDSAPAGVTAPAEPARLIQRAELIRRAGRAEFGRRGYEVTTVRDIAAAAGLSTGTVYRTIGSKEELLAAIMGTFARKVMDGWEAVLGSGATPVEKLDALSWLHINVLDTFSDEFKIQLAWMRQSPPNAASPGWSFPVVLRELKALVSEGSRTGQIRVDTASAELTARGILELTWIPGQIVRDRGKRAALIHARDTVLRGVATR